MKSGTFSSQINGTPFPTDYDSGIWPNFVVGCKLRTPVLKCSQVRPAMWQKAWPPGCIPTISVRSLVHRQCKPTESANQLGSRFTHLYRATLTWETSFKCAFQCCPATPIKDNSLQPWRNMSHHCDCHAGQCFAHSIPVQAGCNVSLPRGTSRKVLGGSQTQTRCRGIQRPRR